ncbi:hypothetical protein K2X85_12675 [bacterium]|nr:hypothetical protein [bacterium]
MNGSEKDQLDDYRFMHGPAAGNLAFVLDRLTDLGAIIAQHKVYCRVEKGPRAGEGSLDVEEALQLLGMTKSLVQKTMMELDPPRTSPAA